MVLCGPFLDRYMPNIDDDGWMMDKGRSLEQKKIKKNKNATRLHLKELSGTNINLVV